MMKPWRNKRNIFATICSLVVIVLTTGLPTSVGAQIAVKGTKPSTFEQTGSLRSPLLLPTVRLGAFDQDSARMAIESSRDDLMRIQIFAHKQMVDVDVIGSGYTGASTETSRVWQYRVSSPGAKSIGLLFEDFYLPEGALLFIYSTDRKQVIGGFGSANNNPARLLSVQPFFADDIVIEVVAPASGQRPSMRLKEVNHGLYDIRGRAFGQKYAGASASLDCTPEVICVPNLGEMPRSVVLLVFDGVGMGTGSMVNNTSGNRRPLLLTAAHVPSSNFKYRNYDQRAATIQVFFNYQSPSCSGEVQPSLTQSVSGGRLVAVDEGRDACLIELNQTPPEDYQAYYAGWNAEPNPQSPFTNIHHPNLQPKSVNVYYGELSLTSFPNSGLPFDPQMHWMVKAWDMGTTALGSSGSPLFDKSGRIVGALSGGNSYCSSRADDYFYALCKVWDDPNPDAQKIVSALDPSGQRRRVCDGLESSAGTASRFVRLSHIKEQFNQKKLEQSLPQLSRADLLGVEYGTTRVQERYMLHKGSEVSGVYIVFDTAAGEPVISSSSSSLDLQIFVGDEATTPILSQTLDLSSVNQPIGIDKVNTPPRYRELYVPFTQKIVMPEDGALHFALNVSGLPEHMSIVSRDHGSDTKANTLYRSIGGKSTAATDVAARPHSASMWIDPMVYHREISEQASEIPLITLSPLGASQVLISFAPRVKGQEARVTMYTLSGQRVYEQTISAGILVLERKSFEGKGVLILRAECGGEKMSVKVLFPTR